MEKTTPLNLCAALTEFLCVVTSVNYSARGERAGQPIKMKIFILWVSFGLGIASEV